MRAVIAGLTKWCAYSHIFKALTVLVNGGQISEQMRAGRNIALLGIFCPFFWIALFTGAEASSLAFHATHSGIVFLIGVAIMVASLKKQQQK